MTKHTRLLCLSFTVMYAMSVHAHSTVYGINGIPSLTSRAHPPFYVQVGAFKHQASAQKIKNRYGAHYSVTIKKHGALYAVIIGPISSLIQLRQLAGLSHIAPASPPPANWLSMPERKSSSLHAYPRYLPVTPITRKHRPRSHKIIPAHQVITATPNQTWQEKVPHRSNTGTSHEWVQPNSLPEQDRSLLLKLEVGEAFTNYPNHMLVPNGSGFSAPYDQDIYTTKQNTRPEISVMLSKQMGLSFSALRSLSLGVRYQYLLPQNLGGDITQYSIAEFYNYTYHWNASAQVITLESKLNMLQYIMTPTI
jgi:hypothetical protein